MTAQALEDSVAAEVRSVSGKRVLVVGINYAPEHTGIAPYTTQACEHLQRLGAEVLVLAGVPHYPQWTVPEEYRGHLRVDEVRRDGVHVRRLRHTVPARQSALSRATYEATFGAHVLVQRLPWAPDIILAVVPSLLGASAAARLANRHESRLVVWVQDLMGPAAAQSGIVGGGQVARLTGRLEQRVLRQADAVLVLNEDFAKYARGLGVQAERLVVRPNWTHVDVPRGNRASTRRRLGWDDDQVVVLHSGNMGLKQGLDNVLAAARIAAVEAPHIRFVLMGDGSQREELQARGADVHKLQFLPPVDEASFPDHLAAADVLLVNERAAAVSMSLPSKLTSYYQAAVPVLAAVPADGGTARQVRESGAGIVINPEEPRALLKAIRDVTENLALNAELRTAGSAYAHRHLGSSPALAALVGDIAGTTKQAPNRRHRSDGSTPSA